MRVLVTGGAGYIGSMLVDRLISSSADVVVVDNMTFTDAGIRHLFGNKRLTVHRGDIRDKRLIRESLKDVSIIVHLAAVANDPAGELDVALTRSINLDAYEPLLSEAKKAGVERFINASSTGVYGINEESDLNENAKLSPLKEYSVCKALSETVVSGYNSSEFTTVNLRLATVCGWSRRQRFDLIVNTLTALALMDGKLVVMGGEQRRPQIHIEDVIDYIISLFVAPSEVIGGEVYNVVGENARIVDLANIVSEMMGGQIEIIMAPPRYDERSYHINAEKVKKILGLVPKRSVRDAVRDIIDAYNSGVFIDPEDSIYYNVLRMKMLGIG